MNQRIIDLSAQAGKDVTIEMKADFEKSNEEAKWAETECKNGFPFLSGYALVGMWGSLEAAVEDMLVGILVNEPDLLAADPFAKIKVPLAKFESLDKEERIRFIVGEFPRTQTGPATQGAATFEKALQAFGLDGDIADDVGKTLWEINHVRNVIVHRDSLADLRLVQACPWLNLKVGDRVCIDHEKLGTYVDALSAYAKTLQERLRKRYGIPAPSSC